VDRAADFDRALGAFGSLTSTRATLRGSVNAPARAMKQPAQADDRQGARLSDRHVPAVGPRARHGDPSRVAVRVRCSNARIPSAGRIHLGPASAAANAAGSHLAHRRRAGAGRRGIRRRHPWRPLVGARARGPRLAVAGHGSSQQELGRGDGLRAIGGAPRAERPSVDETLYSETPAPAVTPSSPSGTPSTKRSTARASTRDKPAPTCQWWSSVPRMAAPP